MKYDNILVREGTIGTITMNRPERRNALSLAMMTELMAALRALAAQPQTRVVILAGNGPAFSAGHDLRELAGGDISSYRRIFDVCTQLMSTVQEIKAAIDALSQSERAELERLLRESPPAFDPEVDTPELEAELLKAIDGP